MHRNLINLIASQPYEALTPFRVMGITAFYYLKLEPALPVGQWTQIEGVCVDVKGDKDVVRVLDAFGEWYSLNPRHAMDMNIAAQLYNRISVEKLETA